SKPPVPTFWVADKPGAAPKGAIKGTGWASNYPRLYDAIRAYKKRERAKTGDQEPPMDGCWAVAVPDPLPVKGAKVTIKGEYKSTFTKATTGAEADPIMGIMTYQSMEYHESPDEKATLPGMKG